MIHLVLQRPSQESVRFKLHLAAIEQPRFRFHRHRALNIPDDLGEAQAPLFATLLRPLLVAEYERGHAVYSKVAPVLVPISWVLVPLPT